MADITEDRMFNIATAKTRKSKSWKNKRIKWSELVKKLSITKRTNETVEEYQKMTKEQKGDLKDIGGFVCGFIKDGRRRAENILSRSMITLDLDHEPFGVWDTIDLLLDFTCLMYSTHSHTPEDPRLRIIIPLDRDVTPEEYEAIARMIASEIDESMKVFDGTTYQASRLMYLPSTCIDGEYIFKVKQGELLKADDVLNKYTFGWIYSEYWPRSKSELGNINKSNGREPQDPTTKTSYIGAFCRTYNIHEAIEIFLSEEYEPGTKENRYKYTKGESADGLIVSDNNLFAYSFQDTDPISGKGACNSFDLVRLHNFKGLDSDSGQLESKDLESFKKMCEFVANDERAKVELLKEVNQKAKEEFGKVDNQGDSEDIRKPKRDIRFMPLGESLIKEPIKEYDFLVNRLLYDNSINLISGDPKTYKTFVAMDIALGVILGTETIGHKVMKKGKVLFASTEFDVRQRFIDLAASRNITDKKILDNIITYIYDSKDTFQWKKDIGEIKKGLEENSIKLLVLDPLSYIFDGDINKVDEVGEFFKELKSLVREFNISVLIVHHNNRMSETKRMNNVSGSSAITRFIDSIIYLERFEEDEKQDINKTDEELDQEFKPIKLIKGPYRHGREGYKYYTLNFKISKEKTQIITERLDTKKDFDDSNKNLNPEQRKSDIENKIIAAINEGKLSREGFKFDDLKAIINNVYGIAERSFVNVLREVLIDMTKDGHLIKEKHSYIYKGM